MGNSNWDFGFDTGIYMVPSGDGGEPATDGITEANAIIEEFLQFEAGLMVRYRVLQKIEFEMLLTNIFFINQKNYSDETGTKIKPIFDYAPKLLFSASVKF